MLKLHQGEYLTAANVRRDFRCARIIQTKYTLDQRLPRHSHDHVYMVIMMDGVLRETALGREHDLHRGHIVFNGAGESHHDVSMAGATRCLNVEFSSAFVAGLGAEGFRLADAVIYANAGAAIGAVGRLHAAMLESPRAPADESLRGPTHESTRELPAADTELEVDESLTALIGAVLAPEASTRDDFRWLPRAIEFLHSTFRQGVLLDDMAAIAGVHRTHLCRAFRKATGCTIGEYVRGLRADLAYQRLSTRGAPLADIAAECGYADQSHMTREVRRSYGRTPSSLRRLSS